MFPTKLCCGTLALATEIKGDGKGCREPQQDKQAIDLFIGIPIVFGSASMNHVCLPLLADHHCMFKAGQPKDNDGDEARVIIQRVSPSLSVSVNGTELPMLKYGRRLHKGDLITMHCSDGTTYNYSFLPFGKTSVFARYDFGKKMGRGACGQVNAVKDRLENTIHAAKAFPFHCEVDNQVRNSMATEYHALKTFSHERVLGSRDAYREAGAIYIIMELAPYGSLANHVYENANMRKVLSELEAAKVVKQMLAGLTYIHRLGYIHCDIKPGNTIVYSINPWQIKICDFGLVAKRSLQRNYNLVGTPPFIAPELIDDNKTWDHRVDSYSLAITAMFLMSARYPYSLPDHVYVLYDGCPTPRKEMVRWDIASAMFPQKLTNDCQQFLVRMAEEDYEKRMEIQDGLLHPWVIKYAS